MSESSFIPQGRPVFSFRIAKAESGAALDRLHRRLNELVYALGEVTRERDDYRQLAELKENQATATRNANNRLCGDVAALKAKIQIMERTAALPNAAPTGASKRFITSLISENVDLRLSNQSERLKQSAKIDELTRECDRLRNDNEQLLAENQELRKKLRFEVAIVAGSSRGHIPTSQGITSVAPIAQFKPTIWRRIKSFFSK